MTRLCPDTNEMIENGKTEKGCPLLLSHAPLFSSGDCLVHHHCLYLRVCPLRQSIWIMIYHTVQAVSTILFPQPPDPFG